MSTQSERDNRDKAEARKAKTGILFTGLPNGDMRGIPLDAESERIRQETAQLQAKQDRKNELFSYQQVIDGTINLANDQEKKDMLAKAIGKLYLPNNSKRLIEIHIETERELKEQKEAHERHEAEVLKETERLNRFDVWGWKNLVFLGVPDVRHEAEKRVKETDVEQVETLKQRYINGDLPPHMDSIHATVAIEWLNLQIEAKQSFLTRKKKKVSRDKRFYIT
jgi:hypothetical protein